MLRNWWVGVDEGDVQQNRGRVSCSLNAREMLHFAVVQEWWWDKTSDDDKLKPVKRENGTNCRSETVLNWYWNEVKLLRLNLRLTTTESFSTIVLIVHFCGVNEESKYELIILWTSRNVLMYQRNDTWWRSQRLSQELPSVVEESKR